MGAGGHKLNNLGQRRILILTKDKLLRWLTVQVAEVKKILGSLGKNNDAGQEVRYRKDGSYIMDIATGEKLELTRSRGTFKFDAWIVPYAMIKSGKVTFKDKDSVAHTVSVSQKTSFSRQG